MSVLKVVLSTIANHFAAKIAETKAAAVKFVDEHLEATAVYLLGHKGKVVLFDLAFSLALYFVGLGSWAIWAHVLLLQNWAFTFVSRARNSGSLSRHLQAGFLSNFVWWVSQVIIFSKLTTYLQGKHGVAVALLTGLYYTAFTLTGSLMAHAQSLCNEKGKTAVGANAKFKQVSIEEWAKVQAVVADFDRISQIAEQAYACSVDAIPTGATAKKVAGETVVTGL